MTTRQKAQLEAAYRATSYEVDGPGGRFVIRVGEVCAKADALLAAHHNGTWAFVTAYNAASAPASRDQNIARNCELERAVMEAGLRFYRGQGRGDDGAWAPEPSLLILGVSEEDALALARRFGQAAIVFGEWGAPARLVWTGV